MSIWYKLTLSREMPCCILNFSFCGFPYCLARSCRAGVSYTWGYSRVDEAGPWHFPLAEDHSFGNPVSFMR